VGYTTDFEGSFSIDPPLNEETKTFLNKFNQTRRMARNVDAKYGIEGEFYVDGTGDYGQAHEANIIDFNRPPSTQPGLWCQWTPNENGTELIWDGGEKFYSYIDWLKYLIKNIFEPRGYTLNGAVNWYGEDREDTGVINVVDNKVTSNKSLPGSGERVKIGIVGVDSGQLMIMDPCYAIGDSGFGTQEDYKKACEVSHPVGGQLKYKMGHDGLGVVFSSGFGDGTYDVYATIKDCGTWGKRVTKVEVILIDED